VNRESRPPATGTDPSPAADEDGAPEAEVPRGAGRIGSRWRNERELAGAIHDRRKVMAALRHGWPMLESSYTPVVVLLVAYALGADLETAVLAALCLSTVLLAGLGYGAARTPLWPALSGGLP
jgi:hypothetical protein